MSATFLTPTVIAKAAAILLKNEMVFGGLVNTQFKNEFKKIGDTLTYRKPVRYLSYAGSTMNTVQEPYEYSDTIVIDKRYHVGLKYTVEDLSLRIEDFADRHLRPACIRLANDVDCAIANLYKKVWNNAGTAGTAPSTFADLAAVGRQMKYYGVPDAGRRLVVDPAAEYSIPDGLKGLLQPTLVEGIVKEAHVGRAAKMDIFGDQNIVYHTAGNPGTISNVLIKGASQTGTTIHLDGATSTTGDLHEGDIITLPGCYAVNPISKVTLPFLQPFVVTALATADGSGNLDVIVDPPVTVTGAYQTVSASPTNDVAITLVSSHRANLAFTKEAIALVFVPLQKPDSAAFAETMNFEGVSITLVKDFDITNYVETTRLDIQFGVKVTYPELACRLLG